MAELVGIWMLCVYRVCVMILLVAIALKVW